MKRIVFTAFAWMFLGVTCIFAKGVLAGTVIMNTAILEYEIDGIPQDSVASNTIIDKVDQIIDVNVVWNDTSPIIVVSGENDKVLTFKVTNLGNGEDAFDLTHEANASSAFVVNNPQIYIDTNNNGVFDISIDHEQSSITLAADAFSIIFLVSDMPAGSYPAGSISSNAIKAKSTIGGSGVPGATYEGTGIGGVFAVDGMSGGVDKAWGVYEMSNDLGVKLTKSSIPSNSEVSIGTIVRYNIVVELQGNGSVDNLIITDAIPIGTIYVADSLKLDGASLTDASDSDGGRFTGSGIEVNLGTVTQTIGDPFSKIISFEVRID